MSVIYTSADTAETVNRAVKNIQGTTTTTDGAAADGMIINENLKPIIQNVTTYTNPTITKTDTGEPPISFHAINAPLIWSISGNVDTDAYVGETSDNLFDKSDTTIQYVETGLTNAQTWKYTQGSAAKTIRIPCIGNTKYTFSSNVTSTVWRIACTESETIPDENTTTVDVTNLSYDVTPVANNTTVTTTANAKYLLFQCSAANFNSIIGALMIIKGEIVPTSYIPYGIVIPIELNGTTYSAYISDYLRKSTGATPVYDIMNSDGTIIRNVNSDGTPAETPTTETYTAPELFTIWGWNVFDVDTTVSPSNVSVTYKDI